MEKLYLNKIKKSKIIIIFLIVYFLLYNLGFILIATMPFINIFIGNIFILFAIFINIKNLKRLKLNLKENEYTSK